MKFTVIGADCAGCVFAAHAKLVEPSIVVALYDPSFDKLKEIKENKNRLHIHGHIDAVGTATLDIVTTDLSEAVKDSSVIFVTSSAHVQAQKIEQLVPYLYNQVIVLMPGRTGGVLEVRKILQSKGKEDILVVETQTLLYSCRRDCATIKVFNVRTSNLCSGIPKQRVPTFVTAMNKIFGPVYQTATSLWHTSLNNVGMCFHTVPMLMNINKIQSGVPFDYYREGFTPSVSSFVEEMDKERLSVAEKLGVQVPSAVQWLNDLYGARGKTLHEAVHDNNVYRDIKAPNISACSNRDDCVVLEDTMAGLVPVSELAKVLGVSTPYIDEAIAMASSFFTLDCRAHGRNIEKLGLRGKSVAEIRQI